MGGNDVIHIKQLQKSNLQPTEVQKLLKQLADERFSEDVNGSQISNPNTASGTLKVMSSEFNVQFHPASFIPFPWLKEWN